jgi:hypothetical protein
MSEILKLGGAAYQPSAALTGNEQATILRGQNMMLRGSEGSFRFEVFNGIKNLNEPIPMGPMTGTLAYTAGDPVIVGTGSLFKSELRPGMKISSGTQVFAVKDVLSNTRFVASRPPDATQSGIVPALFPILFPIDNKRGTLVWGNAVKSDRGNIIAVGQGNLRINGQALAGEELHATQRVQLAIYRPTTDDYEIGKIGFDTSPLTSWVSISTVTGGVRDMTQGLYSYRWSWANSETAYGFSNPSDVIKLDATVNPIAITATNQRHAIDFTTALLHKPSNADAVIIYRSLYSDPVQNPTQAGEGSWFVAATVKISDFETGDIVYIDVLDGELGTEVTFDNDAPPNADWVTFLGGDPILISCYGEKTTTNSLGESPGPFVSIAKRQNRDAFPDSLATPLSPPDTIIGFVASVGRLFLLTRIGLPFASSTGQADFPVTTRAFWQTGFESPFGLVFVNDTLYGFTSKGITRSIATGDEGSEQFAFASFVEDITRDWYAGHVHAVHDSQNELVVFIYSAAYKNDDGFWVSLALPLYLRYGFFGPLITIEKPDRDMVVCGAAKVEGHLQFLAGGRGAVEVLSTSSTETVSSEEVVALSGGLFCCGMECAVEDSFAHLISISGGLNFDTGTVRSGLYSMKVFAAPRIELKGTGVQSVFVGRIYVNFESFPTAQNYFVFSGQNGGAFPNFNICGIAFNPATNSIHCALNLAGFYPYSLTYFGAGFAPSLNTWYRIDFKIDRANGTVDGIVTVDGDLSGTALTQAVGTSSVPTERLYVGAWPNGNSGTFYLDDILVSSEAADYPLEQGFVHAFVATSDGTHHITNADQFERSGSGVDITNATTDAYTLIDEVPMGSSDFIIGTITPPIATDYVEVKLGPAPGSSLPVEGPRMVSSIVRARQAIAGTPEEAQVSLNDNGTLLEIFHLSGAASTAAVYGSSQIPNPPSLPTGEWAVGGAGNGDFNNLKARFYALSGAKAPLVDGMIIEAEFAGDEP